MPPFTPPRLVHRLTGALFLGLSLGALAGCSSSPRSASVVPSGGPSLASGAASASNSQERPPSLETLDVEAASRSARLSAEAISRSLSGAFATALTSADRALASALDLASVSVALEAKAWILLLSGSREEARTALREAKATGAPRRPGHAVLEFRLAAQDGLEAAAAAALASLAGTDASGRASTAIAVMAGQADLRDVELDSPEAASEYATYLAGYSMVQEREALARSGGPADGGADPRLEAPAPALVVITEPESIGADAATVAIARLACRDAMTRSGRYRVVDAASRAAALEELELSLASSQARARDVAVGELFSADYVAGGSVVKTDSGWLVAYSLSSADSGAILASSFSVAEDHAAILDSAGRFASSLDGLAARAPVR